MGRKLDALLGRKFKTSKFKVSVNLAISRLAVLKNHRQARLAVARSDVTELLHRNHHEHALLRVDQVIKEQNMLDAFVLIEGYCLLLTQRINLIEQHKDCPEELEEAISSLLYAAPRCGEFPELQEIRAILTTRFGKEFAYGAIELRNNCKVSHKMIQKLSPRQSNLESRMKMLREIATENGIVLQLEEQYPEEKPVTEQKLNQTELEAVPTSTKPTTLQEDEVEEVLTFSESMKGRKKYKDVADAAQAAFESAAYAAAAARAAVELSRSESFDSDNPDTPSYRPRKVLNSNSKLQMGFDKRHSNSEDEDEKASDFMGVDSRQSKQMEKKRSVFDEGEDEIEDDEHTSFSSLRKYDNGFDGKQGPFEDETFETIRNYESSEGKKGEELKIERERERVQLNLEKMPMSVRTKRVYGRR